MSYTLGTTSGWPLGSSVLSRMKRRNGMDRALEVAELHRRDVGAVVVALLRVVVQPAHELIHAGALDDDRRLAPHDVDPNDRVAESLPERGRRRILRPTVVRHLLRRGGRRLLAARGMAGEHRHEGRVAHRPDRV
jgi:hypothetical protein